MKRQRNYLTEHIGSEGTYYKSMSQLETFFLLPSFLPPSFLPFLSSFLPFILPGILATFPSPGSLPSSFSDALRITDNESGRNHSGAILQMGLYHLHQRGVTKGPNQSVEFLFSLFPHGFTFAFFSSIHPSFLWVFSTSSVCNQPGLRGPHKGTDGRTQPPLQVSSDF